MAVRWRGRSLSTKLFGSFVAVLAVASLLVLLIETSLMRTELAEQTERLTDEQVEAYRTQLSTEEADLTQALSVLIQSERVGPRLVDEQAILDDAPSDDAPSDDVPSDAATDPLGPDAEGRTLRRLDAFRTIGDFDLLARYDVGTGRVAARATTRGYVTPPPDPSDIGLQETDAQRRVIARADAEGIGTYATVYSLPIRILVDPTTVVLGTAFDAQFARDVRDQVGVADIELVVDGVVVASTWAATEVGAAPSGDVDLDELQPTRTGARLIHYLPYTVASGWGETSHVGLVIDDPLAPLDARLVVFRRLMLVLLLVVGGLLSLALTAVLARPLVRLTATARRIAKGDLDASFAITRRDEIGQLAEALERMRRSLRSQLQVIGEQADALQRATRRVVGVRDRERQRLAHDLHDGIQQRLVVLRMQVGWGRARIRERPDTVDEVSDVLAASIDDALDDLRATAQALYPSILRDRGLGGALHSLAAKSTVPIDTVLVPDPLPRVDEDVEANAYFLIAEAVTNALKHADAPRVGIEVRYEDDELWVEVSDGGRGFDPAAVGGRGGLLHLRDRVNAVGGTLRIRSSPADGTRITARLPIVPSGDVLVPPLEVEQDRGDPSVEIELLR